MKLKYTSTTDYGLSRGSERAAAFDLRADKDYQFGGFDRVSSRIIGTGISVAIPDGHVGLVTLRSGHGFKRNFTSHIGIIDSDYRGEIKVKVFWDISSGPSFEMIEKGERFAQLTILPIANIVESSCVKSLNTTKRNEGGFGSTGTR